MRRPNIQSKYAPVTLGLRESLRRQRWDLSYKDFVRRCARKVLWGDRAHSIPQKGGMLFYGFTARVHYASALADMATLLFEADATHAYVDILTTASAWAQSCGLRLSGLYRHEEPNGTCVSYTAVTGTRHSNHQIAQGMKALGIKIHAYGYDGDVSPSGRWFSDGISISRRGARAVARVTHAMDV